MSCDAWWKCISPNCITIDNSLVCLCIQMCVSCLCIQTCISLEGCLCVLWERKKLSFFYSFAVLFRPLTCAMKLLWSFFSVLLHKMFFVHISAFGHTMLIVTETVGRKKMCCLQKSDFSLLFTEHKYQQCVCSSITCIKHCTFQLWYYVRLKADFGQLIFTDSG